MEPAVGAIVLAAGLGTRMRSARAKVLHELGGEPMIARVMRSLAPLAPAPLVVVVGHQGDEVAAAARTFAAGGGGGAPPPRPATRPRARVRRRPCARSR